MQEIRDPGVPDSVPDDLVAVYGAQARRSVRSRRSWRFRQAARLRRVAGSHDAWYLAASVLLWMVVLAGVGGSVVLAGIRWPAQMLDAAVIVAVGAVSSFATARVMRRRGWRSLG